MNKSLIIFLSVLVVLSLIGIVAYPQVLKYYNSRGRTIIYPPESTISDYKGQGHVTQRFEEQLFVIPKFEGRPFFDSVESESIYGIENYDVHKIPAQDQILYSVGIFEAWEDIEGTQDKYILVKYPEAGIEKFRVSFESSDIFKDDTTSLFIEDTAIRFNKEIKNEVKRANLSAFIDITFDGVSEIIKKGDSIVLITVFDPPELSKIDENGNYAASQVIVRRVNGRLN